LNQSQRFEPILESVRSGLWNLLVLSLGAILGVGLVLFAGGRRGALPGGGPSAMEGPAFAPIIEEVLPAVVSIDVEKRFRHSDLGIEGGIDPDNLDPGFPEEEFEIPSSGSGFVIDERGHIITNDHVVRDGVRIDVHTSTGATLPARLVGRDPMTDIAVLEVEPDRPLPVVSLGDSDNLRIGDWVMAIGNPLGVLEGSVTAGIVSAKGRSDLAISGGSPTYQDFIQTDASINPGNSGGPLVNGRGEVVGVSTAFNAPGAGIGFAISINMARSVAEELIRKGRVPRAFLGVNLMALDKELADGWGLSGIQGVVVTDVQPGTPAAEAGLREGDVIIEFNGVKVGAVSPFRLLVARSEVGSRARIRYLRMGKGMEVEVELTERQDPAPSMPRTSSATPMDDLGLLLAPLPGELGLQGVLVDSVLVDSPASRAGMRAGDVILEEGWSPVGNPDDLLRRIERALDQRGVVVFRIQRGSARSYLAVRPR